MATAKPDHLTMYSGIWDTDVSLDTATFLSADASIKFEATTPAVNPSVTGQEVPVAPGDIWMAESVARLSSIAAGNTIGFAIQWLDSAKAAVSSSWVSINGGTGLLPAINTWYQLSEAITVPSGMGICYARPRFDKAKNAFTCNVDVMGIRKVQPGFRAYRTSAQSINSGAGTKAAYDTENYDHGGGYDSVSNYRFTAATAGPYLISASATSAETFTVGKAASISIFINGAFYAYDFSYAVATQLLCLRIIEPILLASGDYVEIFIAHDYGSARTWLANVNAGSFSVTKLN